MIKRSKLCRIIMASLVSSNWLLMNSGELLASNVSWQPQISEKILMLPTKHLEQAIERDFANSLLADDMQTLDQKIGGEISNITSLQENQSLYEGEEALEVEHQIIVGKRNYLEMMGSQVSLKAQQLETKRALYQRLMKQSRQSESRNRDTQELNLVIDQARIRSSAVESKLREELFYSVNQPESKFSQDYAENRAAIEALREAISAHPANRQQISDGQPISKLDELQAMIIETEAELAALSMEQEIIGHMAKLLSFDAMAFAEKLAEQAWQDQAGNKVQTMLSPRENVKMFITF